LNCGSSSVKYHLFGRNFESLLSGMVERIGEGAELVHRKGDRMLKKKVDVKNHGQAIGLMIKLLHDPDWGAIQRVGEISVVGHRVVHGGQLSKTGLVSGAALGYLKSFRMLAPLHNPHNITGIIESKKAMPHVPQVMVFDTAFHQTMPPKAYMYGLPYHFFDKYAIRKYGFHGTSHKYVAMKAAEMLGKKRPNLITCHLGAGSSLTAVKKGKSVDTSMGMTPLEGVMMGTRTGDIDPAVVQYLVKAYKFGLEEIFETMNQKSGLLGISGVSKDVRVIEGRARKGDERCKLALEMFCYRVAKYIGAYAVSLGNVDAIVFTAGIGENSASMRRKICSYLGIIGVNLDLKKNKDADGKERDVSGRGSKVRVLVVPTNEELMIAREAAAVVKGI
ncbi:MAG: acetate kinase, partial [Candidatus Micrarchaeota archaeon]|nr:acetate kinase [Candidatus Micrarchaeota archaeon]